jgi:hypothetical protein
VIIFHSGDERRMPEKITVTRKAASSRRPSASRRVPAGVIAVTRRRSKMMNCGRGFAAIWRET